MSLRTHIALNQSQIKALSGKKFHQTCLPGSTLGNMLFIPLFVLCVCCECVLSSKYTHAGTLYTRDQTLSGCRPAVHSVSCGWGFVCCTVPLVFDAFNMLAEAGGCTVVSSNRAHNLSATCSRQQEEPGPAHREQRVAFGAPDKEGWDGCGE